ncbi:hypothetical protein [Oricola thermophila]|uniref:Uncharacterized protein n=1 Tax=Oricola thermophila TaxID=2742145 RepID=A0A6N1V9W1_9HYPH|nr:hypothetical protein [Oricola thermophila]QKV17736.1 hypothetical protein HTY61_04260 [Oricola thermophila]
MSEETEQATKRFPTRSTIRVLNRTMPVPNSRRGRIALGLLLVAGGIVGFLPVFGFWMLPLGILVLAHDLRRVRRWRRKAILRWSRRGQEKHRG